ncbi:MAG: DUF4276 family protein [Saprospiraceae bacterium]|nr:DUF4276 family protein [Saprospiraceae bacterium]
MNCLVSAYWGEGISDKRFLPVLIQRALVEIMLECAEGEWDILEPIALHPDRSSTGFVEQVLDLSAQAGGFHLLFVHSDADATDENQKVIPHKISPALAALQKVEPRENYCKELVPVIPVVKIENWKLSDGDALRNAIGIDMSDELLGLNMGSKHLEEKGASKEVLAELLLRANEGRRVPVELDDLDAALAKGISLKKIYRFKSFQKFVNRLKESLIRQNIIKTDCSPAFTH